MKVNIRIESINSEGEKQLTDTLGMIELIDESVVDKYRYRLIFLEDLYGDGRNTRSAMYIGSSGMRHLRKGVIQTDFIIEESTEHNSLYVTSEGTLPVSIKTDRYELKENMGTKVEDIGIVAEAEYGLDIGAALIEVKLRISVSSI